MLKNQESLRFTEAELEYLNSYYSRFTGSDEERVSFKTFFLKVFKVAAEKDSISNNDELIAENSSLQEKITSLEDEVKNLNRSLLEAGIIRKNQILLDFEDQKIKQVLDIFFDQSKKQGWATTKEIAVARLISEFQKMGYLIPTQEDIDNYGNDQH